MPAVISVWSGAKLVPVEVHQIERKGFTDFPGYVHADAILVEGVDKVTLQPIQQDLIEYGHGPSFIECIPKSQHVPESGMAVGES